MMLNRKIKVWDLAAALDPRAPTGTLCVRTLVVSDDTTAAQTANLYELANVAELMISPYLLRFIKNIISYQSY